MRFRVSLIQMNSRDDKEANLDRALEMVDEAGEEGADLVALPEHFSFQGAVRGYYAQAEEVPGPTTEKLGELARKYGMYVHCGSIPEVSEREGMTYNTTAFLDGEGRVIGKYRKIHLFDVNLGSVSYCESETCLPGDQVVTVPTDLGTVGLTICYDLRFPELYRLLALKGAQVMMVPASFTLYTGKDHWEPLLRARAIENQVFVVAPAQVGQYAPGKMTYGNSMVVDPWGIPIARASEREQVLSVTIDLDLIGNVREKVPSWQHRAPRVYSEPDRQG